MTLREFILENSGILEEDTFQQRKERRIIDNERNRQKAILVRNKKRAEVKATEQSKKAERKKYENIFYKMLMKFAKEHDDSIDDFGSDFVKFKIEKIDPIIGNDHNKEMAYYDAYDKVDEDLCEGNY